ncbi:prepilin-type N-terminal cleavage/methylation domain-containing protein [Bacilli bacterium PM5-9]|nr:prepilin-type N-terminal cleavage/methylation domain-containing protein [Bacilli bacterium PM5-9]
MVKLKLNSNGFVLIEVVVVIMIISVILLTNLSIYNNSNVFNFYLSEDKLLETKLNAAKQLALNSKNIVDIKFNQNTLIIQRNSYIETNTFKTINFETSKELYFNKNGNLNQGYTLLFKHGIKYKKLIFYLGKGWYKIE